MRVFKAETSVDLERFRRYWSDVLVCAEFLKTGLIALAQGMPLEGQSGVPKNVFITSTELQISPVYRSADKLTPATVLHEALHGLLFKTDAELANYFLEAVIPEAPATLRTEIIKARDNLKADLKEDNTNGLDKLLSLYACAPQ